MEKRKHQLQTMIEKRGHLDRRTCVLDCLHGGLEMGQIRRPSRKPLHVFFQLARVSRTGVGYLEIGFSWTGRRRASGDKERGRLQEHAAATMGGLYRY